MSPICFAWVLIGKLQDPGRRVLHTEIDSAASQRHPYYGQLVTGLAMLHLMHHQEQAHPHRLLSG